MNVLICDDNAKEREWCHKELLKNQGYFEEGLKVLEYESGNELLFKYPDLDIDIDIIFLDIMMPGLDGITVAKKLRDMNYSGEIIFFTGTIDYAVNGYDYEALAYLIKGKTSSERFSEVLRHFLLRKGERSGEVIILRCAGETRVINLSSIRYFEVFKRLTTVYYGDSTFSFYSPLAKLSEELEGKNFIRIHRAYLVNSEYIAKKTMRDVTLRDGTVLPAGRNYIKKIKED
jgi:two component transcriptional regulator, lytTR family